MPAGASVAVASALDGDAVVAGVEEAVLDEHVLARLGVAAVAVGAVVLDVHAAHGEILAEQGMYHPERRAEQGHILDEHVLALHGIDELDAHAVAVAHHALLHGHAVFVPLHEDGDGLCAAR